MEGVVRATLSVKEAAQLLGISKNLAYQLARQGKLPGTIRLGQKRIVVSRVAIERLLSEPNSGLQDASNGGA
jgi:excisionase family DNA binding protein